MHLSGQGSRQSSPGLAFIIGVNIGVLCSEDATNVQIVHLRA
jgi:hypothetical protein